MDFKEILLRFAASSAEDARRTQWTQNQLSCHRSPVFQKKEKKKGGGKLSCFALHVHCNDKKPEKLTAPHDNTDLRRAQHSLEKDVPDILLRTNKARKTRYTARLGRPRTHVRVTELFYKEKGGKAGDGNPGREDPRS